MGVGKAKIVETSSGQSVTDFDTNTSSTGEYSFRIGAAVPNRCCWPASILNPALTAAVYCSLINPSLMPPVGSHPPTLLSTEKKKLSYLPKFAHTHTNCI